MIYGIILIYPRETHWPVQSVPPGESFIHRLRVYYEKRVIKTGEQSKTFPKVTFGDFMDDETFLHERIEVIATFGEGLNPCKPVRFRRANGREVIITEIGLRHPSAKGFRTMHMFDVTDDETDYRIEFDSERLTWHLTRIGDGL